MEKICKSCGKLKEHKAHGKCDLCYRKEEFTNIPRLGARKKAIQHVFTNGMTKDIKPLVKKIKEKILNDCIKNPSKYLNTQDNENKKEGDKVE